MHAEQHICTMNPHLPHNLTDKLLTAVEAVLNEVGAARIWVDPSLGSPISVMAELPGPRLSEQM